jgi:polyphosphate kinase
VAFPVLNAKLRHRIRDDLERYLKDTSNAWLLGSDGQYRRALEDGVQALGADDAAPVDAQAQLLEAYAAAARLPE